MRLRGRNSVSPGGMGCTWSTAEQRLRVTGEASYKPSRTVVRFRPPSLES